jgi:hypothetical protein
MADLKPCPHIEGNDPAKYKLCRIERGEWVGETPEDQRHCLYEGKAQHIKQKCGGPIGFGVKGFFKIEPPKADDKYDFYLCHEHRKWWNKYAHGVAHWCPMPIARKVK